MGSGFGVWVRVGVRVGIGVVARVKVSYRRRVGYSGSASSIMKLARSLRAEKIYN